MISKLWSWKNLTLIKRENMTEGLKGEDSMFCLVTFTWNAPPPTIATWYLPHLQFFSQAPPSKWGLPSSLFKTTALSSLYTLLYFSFSQHWLPSCLLAYFIYSLCLLFTICLSSLECKLPMSGIIRNFVQGCVSSTQNGTWRSIGGQ